MAKESSASTIILSVVALIFGLIGMFSSFIPCLGSLAILLALPSALLAGIATYVAYAKKEAKTFPLVALTISMIGLVISVSQLTLLSGGLSLPFFFSSPAAQEQPASNQQPRQEQPSNPSQPANNQQLQEQEPLKQPEPIDLFPD